MSRLIPLSLVLAVGLAASGSAFAHAYLKTAVPAKNGTVHAAPTEVVIDFTEGVEPKFSTIEVQDATGARVDTGDVHGVAGNKRRLVVGLRPLSSGSYKVIWHVTSTDTHKTEGNYRFTVAP